MTSTLWGLPVQRVAGFFAAHATASAAPERRVGLIGHSVTGLVGGAATPKT